MKNKYLKSYTLLEHSIELILIIEFVIVFSVVTIVKEYIEKKFKQPQIETFFNYDAPKI